MPCLIEELKIAHTGRLSIGAKHFKTVFGISSGPIDLRSLIDDSERSTASTEMTYSSGTATTGIEVHSSDGMSLATLLNDSLIALANSALLKTRPSTVILVRDGGLDRPEMALMLSHHFFGLVSSTELIEVL